MKKVKVLLLALVALAVPIFAFASTSYAGDFQSGGNIIIKENEVIDRTLFVAGNNVEIGGTINGDIFCAGQNVTINATVSGDVICAGQNVRIEGTVDGDVRVAGQTVTMLARVGHNASLAGETVTMRSDSQVDRDLQVAGNNISLAGEIGRDVDAGGEMVTISSTIGRNVNATTSNLALTDGATLRGNLTYYSQNELSRDTNVRIAGDVARHEPESAGREKPAPNPVGDFLMSFFMLLATAFVLLAIFPRLFNSVADGALKSPGKTVLFGLGAAIGVPLLIILTFLTLVGILLGVTFLLAWIVVLLLSGVFFSYFLGRLIFIKAPQHPFVTMLVGVALVSVLMLIPIVNVITFIAIGVFGTGMLLQEIFARTPAPVYEAPVSRSAAKTGKKK